MEECRGPWSERDALKLLVYMCPHTTICVLILCVLILLYICVLTQMEECRGLRSERDTLKLSAEEAVRKAQLQAQN